MLRRRAAAAHQSLQEYLRSRQVQEAAQPKPAAVTSAVRQPDASSGVQVGEIVAAIALAADLGLGQPMEHVAGNHIERIYTKIGASSRATAALFAMESGLLATLEPSDS